MLHRLITKIIRANIFDREGEENDLTSVRFTKNPGMRSKSISTIYIVISVTSFYSFKGGGDGYTLLNL